jgi:two-component system cell cycle response regulator CpdR
MELLFFGLGIVTALAAVMVLSALRRERGGAGSRSEERREDPRRATASREIGEATESRRAVVEQPRRGRAGRGRTSGPVTGAEAAGAEARERAQPAQPEPLAEDVPARRADEASDPQLEDLTEPVREPTLPFASTENADIPPPVAARGRRDADAERGRTARDGLPSADSPPSPAPAVRPPRQRVVIGFDSDLLREAERHLESLAAGTGNELGDLATAVEGHANLLCEAIGDPEHVAQRAEQLWTSVRRVRLFSEKLLAFARPPQVTPRPLELLDLLRTLRSDLESYASGAFNVHFESASILPPATVDPEQLRMAMLFLVDTLLTLQPNTRQISLRAYTRIPEDDSPIVCIELCAEAEPGVGQIQTRPASMLQIGYLAARNLLEKMNAHLAFEHIEGLDVSCEIMLAAVLDTYEPAIGPGAAQAHQTTAAAVASVPPSEHRFGGILILEDDRSVRELLAMELGRSGRSIITCGDGAAAHSLLEATPERFELLVLDGAAPMETGESLASWAHAQEPGLRFLLLTDALGFQPDTSDIPKDQLVRLRKPFNLSDLRDAVRQLMGACPPPPIAHAARLASEVDEPDPTRELPGEVGSGRGLGPADRAP